jgi:hypothetical protein
MNIIQETRRAYYVFVCIMNKKQMNNFVEKYIWPTKDLYRNSPMDSYSGDFDVETDINSIAMKIKCIDKLQLGYVKH